MNTAEKGLARKRAITTRALADLDAWLGGMAEAEQLTHSAA
jgi:hypothetical protein